jgi:hypothetical protein
MAIALIAQGQQTITDPLSGGPDIPSVGRKIGGINAVYGVPLNEVGINISRFSIKYFPEVDATFPDYVGQTAVRVVSANFSRTVECDGEVIATIGIMAFTLAIACSFANAVSHFGPTGGSFYLDEATVDASRRGWVSVKIKATAKATL